MAWVAVKEDDSEHCFELKPIRDHYWGQWDTNGHHIKLPSGSIEKLIGRKLTWSDEPIELKEE